MWLTSDPDEAMGVADRIAIMKEGTIQSVLDNIRINKEVLVKLIT